MMRRTEIRRDRPYAATAAGTHDRVRPRFTRKLQETMRGEIPFFGDVIIYLLRTRP